MAASICDCARSGVPCWAVKRLTDYAPLPLLSVVQGVCRIARMGVAWVWLSMDSLRCVYVYRLGKPDFGMFYKERCRGVAGAAWLFLDCMTILYRMMGSKSSYVRCFAGCFVDCFAVCVGLVGGCAGVRSGGCAPPITRLRLQETITSLDLFVVDVSVCSLMFHWKINVLERGVEWGCFQDWCASA